MKVAKIIATFLGMLAVVAIIEWIMGRSPLGPDGKFGWVEENIWSAECSQRVADAYSFSHVAHGILLFGFLWLIARSLTVGARFLMASVIEAGWELLENSTFIIDRYRESTMALGYAGDSLVNSASDICMMALGFLLAWRLSVWATVSVLLVMEIGCALWIRDNLALNVIMLIHPIDAIKHWQMGAHQ